MPCAIEFSWLTNWGVLLKVKNIRIPLINITGTYLISTFLGVFLPATVGGDALRAYAVSREGHNSNDVISSIIVERLLGFIANFIFVLVGIVLCICFFKQEAFDSVIWSLLWLFLILLAVTSVLTYLSFNGSVLRRLRLLFESRDPNIHNYGLVRKLKGVYRSYESYQGNIVHLGVFFFLSLAENLFPLFWTYFLSLAFNIEIPLVYFFILVPIVLILVRLPISLDGIGIQEGAFVFFLLLIGVPESEALLLGIASHILAILSILPGGILYCFSGLSFRVNMNREREDVVN